jgi:hypothetical protein
MKVSVITVTYNKPEFIKPQRDLLVKFLKNEFDYFVYNNSDSHVDEKKIEGECFNNNIKYHRIPQNIFSGGGPSYRAGLSLDYAIKHNIENFSPDYMLILDSDMFLYEYLEISSYMEGLDFIGIYQTRGEVFYYTNQLCMVNVKKCPSFKDEIKFLPGEIRGNMTDCGGFLFEYINKYDIKHKDFNNKIHSGMINSENIGSLFDSESIIKSFFMNDIDIMGGKSFSEIFHSFLHFRAGSNWINFDKEISNKRESNLFEFFNKIEKYK